MSWSSDKYFAKAQLYWTRATALERESQEFLLTVSFFCEFVIRGALVRGAPILNAAIEEESVIFAAGLKPNRPPRSVDISLGLARLGRLIPNLTEEDSKVVGALITARNAELHGDSDEIHLIPNKEVLPRIYAFVVNVADWAGQDVIALMGDDDGAYAKRIAEAVLKDRKRRVVDLIRIQKDRFFGLPKDEQGRLREAGKPTFVSAVTKAGHHLRAERCPACAGDGILGGTPVGRSAPILREDGIVEEVRTSPDVFECKCCDLAIRGLDELLAAGFAHEFTTVDDKDVVEMFGIDPMEYVDVEDVVREYHENAYDYQDD
jgi:hypothetical protein